MAHLLLQSLSPSSLYLPHLFACCSPGTHTPRVQHAKRCGKESGDDDNEGRRRCGHGLNVVASFS
jgi:hypothetical protein